MISRADRGSVANWWWTIDKTILAACLALIGLGILLSFAASPSVAIKIGKADPYDFVKQHIFFTFPALITMIAISFFSPVNIRRFCAALLIVTLALLAMTLMFGIEIKGSVRWIKLIWIAIQPSEFMKPAFVVMSAWLFSEQNRNPKIPGFLLSGLIYIICAALLILEPDIGQTMLISMTWGGLFFLAGVPIILIILFLALTVVGGFGAYFFVHHVHERVNGFLTGEGDTFQVDMGRDAIIHGGWIGQGPGEGTIKRLIPDSHTDFVFSVAAEEYGIVLCIVIIGLFAYIVIRSMTIALKERDIFTRFAITGVAMLIGCQSIINTAVNLHLMPPKGMTLPFISYGGSSMIAVAISMGILLALTRRRPEARLAASLPHLGFSHR